MATVDLVKLGGSMSGILISSHASAGISNESLVGWFLELVEEVLVMEEVSLQIGFFKTGNWQGRGLLECLVG